MARVTRGFKARHRRKRILKLASGHIGTRNRLFRTAVESVERGLVYAYRDRKTRKRQFRRLWITRLNAAAREHGISYSVLIAKLKAANIDMDRRVLAELAINDTAAFAKLVSQVNAA